MDLTKALDFLEKQELNDYEYQDSGLIEHLAENMQKYADQQLVLNDVVNQRELLKAFADYAQKRMWEDDDKDLSEFVDEFLRL